MSEVISKVLELVQIIRSGQLAGKRVEALRLAGEILIGVAALLAGQDQQTFGTAPGIAVPETLEGCCAELEAQFDGEGATFNPFMALVIKKLISLVLQELI